MWGVWFFGVIFFVTGAVPLFIAIKTFRKDREIGRWPRAPGKILSSQVNSRRSKARDKQGYMVESTVFEPVVTYTYTVDGYQLSGDRISRHSSASGTEPDISQWPANQDVMVLYDPNDPTTAYLETQVSVGAVILAIMGGVFSFVGLLVPFLVFVVGGKK